MSWKWPIAALIILFVLYSCGSSSPEKFRKFTITVQTPNGVKTGTSIVGFTYNNPPWWYPSASGGISVNGEAAVVEVKDNRFLFLPVDHMSDVKQDIGSQTALSEFRRENGVDNNNNIIATENFYPFLVSFENIDDPSSGFQVKPNEISEIFGSDYKLISIKSEPSDGPPTFASYDRFPKLFKTHYGLRGRRQ